MTENDIGGRSPHGSIELATDVSQSEIHIADMSWFFDSLGSDTIEAEIDWDRRVVILRRHDEDKD